uniref:Antibiotic resistance protein n=1 Tax=uncultured bacterium contig00086 TaxID=1181559 RepID=A0A806K1B7_9BACT|nr:antibiotic resistance protein [uncultured bacterium contig00086]
MSFNDFQEMSFGNLDCDIHYWYKKGGDDNYILLFHGAGCDHLMFEKQIAVFENAYNIIAWDARGHGMSKLCNGRPFNFGDMYSDSLELFKIHSIKKAILLGQSMGGNLVQEIAYHSPELVSKCILIDCTKNTQKLTFLEKAGIKMSRAVFDLYPWKTLIRQSANACGKTEYTRNYVQNCFEKIEKENFIEIMMSLFTCLHEDKDFKFRQPVLLICGKDDRSGNIKKAMNIWAKNDRNCNLYMIENAGHNSNQDNPDDVNKHIKMFLA